MNIIPKEKNRYDNKLKDFAVVDDKLAASAMAIGESSNLSQLAQTYSYSFNDNKYVVYADILAVLAWFKIGSVRKKFRSKKISEFLER